MMLAAFMMFVLRKGGSMTAEYESQATGNELVNFNRQFEAYVKEDNTYFDVITASNLAYDVNKNNNYDLSNSVTVKLCLNSNYSTTYSIMPYKILAKNYFFPQEEFTTSEDSQIYMYDENLIEYTKTKDNQTTEISKTFTGTAHYSELTGKIDIMTFKVNN